MQCEDRDVIPNILEIAQSADEGFQGFDDLGGEGLALRIPTYTESAVQVSCSTR